MVTREVYSSPEFPMPPDGRLCTRTSGHPFYLLHGQEVRRVSGVLAVKASAPDDTPEPVWKKVAGCIVAAAAAAYVPAKEAYEKTQSFESAFIVFNKFFDPIASSCVAVAVGQDIAKNITINTASKTKRGRWTNH